MASDTRERIISVAMDLWSRQGYDGTGLQEIADRVGIRKPSLYFHFSSKQELLATVLRPYVEATRCVVDALEGTPSTPATRRTFYRAWLTVEIDNWGPSDVLAANHQLLATIKTEFPGSDPESLGPRALAWLVGPDPDPEHLVRGVSTLKVISFDYMTKVTCGHLPHDELTTLLADTAEATLTGQPRP